MPSDSEEIDDAGIDNLSNGQVIIGNFIVPLYSPLFHNVRNFSFVKIQTSLTYYEKKLR